VTSDAGELSAPVGAPAAPAPRVRPPLGYAGPTWVGDGALGAPAVQADTRTAVETGSTNPLTDLGLIVAPWHLRLGAFVVDEFILSMVFGFAATLLGVAVNVAPTADMATVFAETQRAMQPYVPILYVVEVLVRWPWCAVGWSPGKRLFGLRVVDAEGNPPGIRRGLTRAAFTLASELPVFLGFVWALFDHERRTWHDHLAQTWVVRKPQR
jgi:uncharacterized RDD family membrane protein YckC